MILCVVARVTIYQGMVVESVSFKTACGLKLRSTQSPSMFLEAELATPTCAKCAKAVSS